MRIITSLLPIISRGEKEMTECEKIKTEIIKDLIATRTVRIPVDSWGGLDFIVKFCIDETAEHVRKDERERIRKEILKSGVWSQKTNANGEWELYAITIKKEELNRIFGEGNGKFKSEKG